MEYRERTAMMKARYEDQIHSYEKKIEELESSIKCGAEPGWKELNRLNEIMKMSEDIFKKYEVETADSRRQLNGFKEKLKRDDAQTEKLLFSDFNMNSNRIAELETQIRSYEEKVNMLARDK